MHGFESNDTMFSVRQLPWHGIGKVVEEAPNSAEAIKLAGLDWDVQLREMYLDDGTPIPSKRACCRESEVLGIVSDMYHPVQNTDAFSFMDSLVGEEVGYETAGSIFGGRRVFMTAKVQRNWTIDGDALSMYLLLSNDHTGNHALKVAVTPVRVVCYNTLQCAIRDARHIWSVRHYTNIESRIAEARQTLCLAGHYMDAFEAEANRLLNMSIPMSDVDRIVENVLRKPSGESVTTRESLLYEHRLAQLRSCLNADDLANFRTPTKWNAWGLVNAMSDYETHTRVRSKQNILGKLLNGSMPLTEQVRELATAVAI